MSTIKLCSQNRTSFVGAVVWKRYLIGHGLPGLSLDAALTLSYGQPVHILLNGNRCTVLWDDAQGTE